ncbi:MAG: 23S rRNA (guanosine(2251)-2'-O)-methyltransferase RlmB [Gemmatimonadaceae bacterium]|nr:23S rRNA (guanosine(2251)-2'-O)-methyltransferase RlmB [Chitinophagaceae bacterium]
MIIGRKPILEAIQGGKQIDRIFMLSSATGESIQDIRDLAFKHNIPINKVPAEKLNSLSNGSHQGCIAIAASVQYHNLQEVISFITEKGETPLFVMLDGVTDVRNIGAIARTALCCGAQAMVIADKGVGALNEDAIKTSAGALEKIYICRVNSLMKAVDEMHLNGIKVFASEMTAQAKLHDLPLTEPACVILGGEEKGVFTGLMKICDTTFQIPMPGAFESLNVSVAAGMILYEAVRQRLQ